MDSHDRLLAAFLAGDLDPADAQRWDEHLLRCERCWRAVREDRAGRQAGGVPAAVAAVARYAQVIPPPSGEQHPQRAAPVQVGRPVTVTAGGQRMVLRTWRLGGAEAVVAVSGRPFPMPAHARGISGRGMAWSARLGRLGLYCLNGQTSELVAAPVPAAELAALAAQLPLA